MTLALTKGHPVVTAGLAAITGTGVALGFTELGSSTSTWLLILATAIPLAVSSPFVAGWLSPELKHAWFFPVGVLASLSIATAIYGNLSLDSHPVAFVSALTVIYGGAASLAFCVGWIARQYLRRLRGNRLPVSHLSIASLVAVCCSIALIVLRAGLPDILVILPQRFAGHAVPRRELVSIDHILEVGADHHPRQDARLLCPVGVPVRTIEGS